MTANQFLVILRGAPSSGKTTISKRLRNLEKKIAWVKVDNFKDFFADDSSEALEYVNGSAIATLKYLFSKGFSVIVDGIFQDTNAIDEALKLAKEMNIKSIVYEIRCPLDVLMKRDKEREGIKEGLRTPLGDEVITKIYEKLKSSPYPSSSPLDTEDLTIEECVSKIEADTENLPSVTF